MIVRNLNLTHKMVPMFANRPGRRCVVAREYGPLPASNTDLQHSSPKNVRMVFPINPTTTHNSTHFQPKKKKKKEAKTKAYLPLA